QTRRQLGFPDHYLAISRDMVNPRTVGPTHVADNVRLFWPCAPCHNPGSLDCTTWNGLIISGTKQPSIGDLPSRLTILSSKTRCLSWRPCAKRSPITSRTVSQVGNSSPTSLLSVKRAPLPKHRSTENEITTN